MQNERSLWLKTLYGNWVNAKYIVAFRHVTSEETTDVIKKGDKYYQAKTLNQEWYAISEKMFDKFQNYFMANNELLDED